MAAFDVDGDGSASAMPVMFVKSELSAMSMLGYQWDACELILMNLAILFLPLRYYNKTNKCKKIVEILSYY